jgi:hypothetical protein
MGFLKSERWMGIQGIATLLGLAVAVVVGFAPLYVSWASSNGHDSRRTTSPTTQNTPNKSDSTALTPQVDVRIARLEPDVDDFFIVLGPSNSGNRSFILAYDGYGINVSDDRGNQYQVRTNGASQFEVPPHSSAQNRIGVTGVLSPNATALTVKFKIISGIQNVVLSYALNG